MSSPTLIHVNSLWTEWADWFPSMWLLLVTISIFYYWMRSQSRFVRLINAIPGPKSLPLLGNILHLDVYNENFLKMTTIDWVQKYGPMYRVWLCTRPFVILSSPELVQKILASPKLITKSVDYSNFSNWLGNCMFTSTGTQWKNRRRLVTPGFHFQNHTSFIDIFNEKSFECAREFEETIDAHAGDVEIDINPLMAKCALNIICVEMTKLDALQFKIKETAMGQQTRIDGEKAVYVNNVHRICQIFVERVSRPWLSIDWIYKLTALGRESEQCISVLHDFTNKVTRDRREMLKREEEKKSEMLDNVEKISKRRFAFVDGLIKASNEGADLNDNGIREEIDLITFAGYDTTSAAMVWFLYLIAKHPEHQQLIWDELDAVFCR
uniref:Cytochrome P450 n=1 Tax=Daphnia galeata TaxID=27404 RepID=A0A8J2RL68_9CRUS|nr:unnamed protein product [Daphnia galeata]